MPKPILTVVSNVSRRIRHSERPFFVAKYDRLTRERIFSPGEEAIIRLIESAVEEINNAAQGNVPIARKPEMDLRRAELDGRRARLISDQIRSAAMRAREWSASDNEYIAQILFDAPLPFEKPRKPRDDIAVSEFLENLTLSGYEPRLVIEGCKRIVILFDALGDELVRFPVRDGDRLHARDIVEGFRVAEENARRHS